MQDFYRCEAGYKDRANQVANKACYKLVKDMHYEAHIQAVVQYCAEHEKKEGEERRRKENIPHAGVILDGK